MTRQPRVVIIGAGIAGITTAVTLHRAGFHDFTILEKGADVGGVWHWNRYPGLTCDVPSQLYQFSFAPKPDWTGLFAPGPEIQRYLSEVVDQFASEFDIGAWTPTSGALDRRSEGRQPAPTALGAPAHAHAREKSHDDHHVSWTWPRRRNTRAARPRAFRWATVRMSIG
jgi:cation diffusion facilitator CzcD-associated flavoprotein CzcO